MDIIQKQGNIIIQFDNIIYNTTLELYNHLITNILTYNKYINKVILNKEELNNRPTNNIVLALLKENIMKLNKKEALREIATLNNSIINNFYKDYNFTQNQLTDLAKKAIVNPIFLESPGIKTIYILIETISGLDGYNKRKKEFIKKIFKNSDKVKIIECLPNNNKAEVIQKKKINWDLYISDDIGSVEKLCEKDIDHKEFMIPKVKYCIPTPELLEVIKLKSANITRF